MSTENETMSAMSVLISPVLLFRGYSVGAVADTGTMSPDRSSLT